MFIHPAQIVVKNLWEFFFNLNNPVILSTLIMFFILLLIIYLVKHIINPLIREHEQEKNKAVEKEKHIIACELHDTVIQNLVSVKRSISIKSDKRESELIKNTIEEIRRICNELMPRELEDNGLQEAVESLIESAIEKYSISFNTDIKIFGIRFLQEMEINVFRIIQEALNNIIRHSGADLCSIKIGLKKDVLNIIISDNGVGFNQSTIVSSQNKKSFGLLSMKFRAVSMGGKIFIDSVPGAGTIIHVEIPLQGKMISIRNIFN